MTKLAEKLKDRIKREFDINVEPIIRRTRAGRWQRSAGTWSWFMQCDSGNTISSSSPASEVMKWNKWIFCDYEIVEG